MVAGDLPRQKLVEVALQRCDAAREIAELVKRQHTIFGIFQCDGLAAMALGAYAIHADHIAQHVIARHLLAAVLGQHGCLARTRLDRVQRGE